MARPATCHGDASKNPSAMTKFLSESTLSVASNLSYLANWLITQVKRRSEYGRARDRGLPSRCCLYPCWLQPLPGHCCSHISCFRVEAISQDPMSPMGFGEPVSMPQGQTRRNSDGSDGLRHGSGDPGRTAPQQRCTPIRSRRSPAHLAEKEKLCASIHVFSARTTPKRVRSPANCAVGDAQRKFLDPLAQQTLAHP
jgi:hypothetical protein